MALKILVVPDKFKGTLTAEKAAAAIADGWRRSRAEDLLELLPMSDGGDGFGSVISRLLAAESQTVETVDAAHRPLIACWWWAPQRRLAVVESANVIGLALLPPQRHHPFELDTGGLGAVLESVAAKRAEQVLIGIGGSATNDGGFGVARALGWQFLTPKGQPITQWTNLKTLDRIEPPPARLPIPQATVAVDVRNPLLGPNGASHVYGPQKGLREPELPEAERCLDRLAEVVKRDLGLDHTADPGAGAAGGLGYGLRCFLGATLESGVELFARLADLDQRVASADLVITGEGAVDDTTLMGKGVGQIGRRAQELGVPCLALAGCLGLSCGRQSPLPLFTEVHTIAPRLAPAEQAKAEAAFWLTQLAAEVARDWRG